MAQITSINFSSDAIRVVKADYRKDAMRVVSASTMTEQEFDEFLTKDPSESYVVSVNFKELFQDILYLPPAEDNFIDSLVQREIYKLHPDLTGYTYFYQIIGDIQYEGKSFKWVVCFLYAIDDVAPIISRFTRQRKLIKYLYSTAYALSRLVEDSSTATDEAMLCIEGSTGEKSLFLMENKRLYFVRHIQSLTSGIDTMDAQNVNMTVDYCSQSLRVKPLLAVFIGPDETTQGVARDIMLPMQKLSAPSAIDASPDIIWEYSASLAALLCLTTPHHGNILPRDYRQQSFSMNVLRKGAYILLFLCLLTGLGSVMKTYSIIGLHEEITSQRRNSNSNERIMREYTRLGDELTNAAPIITSINNTAAQTNQQQALIALGCLNVTGVQTTSILLNRKDDNTLKIEIKGELAGVNYSATEAAYENLIASIRATGKLEIVTKKMDPISRSFIIELLYKA